MLTKMSQRLRTSRTLPISPQNHTSFLCFQTNLTATCIWESQNSTGVLSPPIGLWPKGQSEIISGSKIWSLFTNSHSSRFTIGCSANKEKKLFYRSEKIQGRVGRKGLSGLFLGSHGKKKGLRNNRASKDTQEKPKQPPNHLQEPSQQKAANVCSGPCSFTGERTPVHWERVHVRQRYKQRQLSSAFNPSPQSTLHTTQLTRASFQG